MNIVILAYFVAALLNALGQKIPTTPPTVTTNSGKIEGVWSSFGGEAVKEFLGIPYAKPPLGNLRFLKPEPVKSWSDTLKAVKQPPGCVQYTQAPFPWYDNMTGKSEDCLYLNIYTPFYATKGSKLPVMFWIFGGGLTLGSIRADEYDGRVLAQKEGIVLVTVNYRLGVFGFFTSNTTDAPGNVGLYDQVMGLQWVNDNIEYFGGDKDRITIFGESAGSISTSILCTSPLTKGLFSGAILESGSVIFYKNNGLDFNMNLGEQLAEAVGCAKKDFTLAAHPQEVVSCMRQRNATYLAENLWKLNPWSTSSFFPQYGDNLLPNNALDDIQKGNFNNVPLLIGVNQDEGSLFVSTANPGTFGFFGEKNFKVNRSYAETLLKGIFTGFPNPQDYVNYYLKGVSDSDSDKLRYQAYTAYGDVIALCATMFFSESYAKYGNDVHFYYFTHRPSNSIWADWMGVAHYDEVQFVFGIPIRKPTEYQPDEIPLSSRMTDIWANFATNRKPGTVENWPKYSKGNNTYFTLDVKDFGKLGTGPHLENCNFLRSYYGF